MSIQFRNRKSKLLNTAVLSLVALQLARSAPQTKDPEVAAAAGDIPKKVSFPLTGYDYVKREVMIPMRDGIKLYTVIVVPKNAHNAPI